MSRTRFVILLLVLGTLAVYLPASHHGFSLFDDKDYISENPIVQNGLSWAGVKWAFTTWYADNWHPVTWLSHMLDCQLFGGFNAGTQHVVNVLFHTANTVLLLMLLLRLTNAFWPAAAVAALFAWHPLHVESVAWLSERKDVLSTFFALLTLLAYTKYVMENRRRFYWLSVIFFALGLMSKPMLVTLPFVLLLLDYWPLQRFKIQLVRSGDFRVVLEKIPFFLLTAISCVLTFLAQHHGGAVVSLKSYPLSDRLENAPVAVVRYLLKMVWPENLAVFYPMIDITPLVLVASLVVLILISIAVWLSRKDRPHLLVGWLWFLGTLGPVIGLVQVGSASLADRYTYFPSIGIFLAATLGVRDAVERFHVRKTVVATATGSMLAGCLWLTHNQLGYWRDDIALFRHAVAVTKSNPVAHLNLGFALLKAGKNQEAIDQFRTTLELEPHQIEAMNNLGILLDDTGHPDEALAEYESALRLNPHYVPARENLGTLLFELGRFDDAMQQFAEAQRLDPNGWQPLFLTGKALLQQKRDAEAIPYFQKALLADPNNLRVLLVFAQVLASDSDPQVRDGHAARLMAEKANALSSGIQPTALDTLAMAYAELGQFDDAQKTEQNALDLAHAFDATNDIPLLTKRLELYKKNQPLRQSFTNALVEKLQKSDH